MAPSGMERADQPGFVLWSDAVHPMTREIEARYTCDLDNSSPELRWSGIPDGTTSLALIVRDLDAPGGTFCHWVVYQILPHMRHLPAGIPAQELLPNGIRQGLNSTGRLGYLGPCPPVGDPPHRYVFELLALDGPLPATERRPTGHGLEALVHDRIIGRAVLEASYRRYARRLA